MNKHKLAHFPRLTKSDEVLYMNKSTNNISICFLAQCSTCIRDMKKHYAGYLRDGIFHYETKAVDTPCQSPLNVPVFNQKTS